MLDKTALKVSRSTRFDGCVYKALYGKRRAIRRKGTACFHKREIALYISNPGFLHEKFGLTN